MRKNNSGFTLVELLVTIAAAALVLVAVSSLLLTGLRLEGRGSETVAAQRDSRVVLTMLENIAAEGQIDKIEYDASNWKLQRDISDNDTPNYETILSYDSTEQAIKGKDGGVIMDEISFAEVSFDDRKKLLTCSITNVSGESYSTSVYCRVGSAVSEGVSADELTQETEDKKEQLDSIQTPTNDEKEQLARYSYLVTLLSQYGSTGKISDSSKYTINDETLYLDGAYYAQWFALHVVESEEDFFQWGRGTPWCACYLSWALAKQFEDDEYPLLSASVGYMLFDQFDISAEKAKLEALGYAPEKYESDLFNAVGDFRWYDGYTPIPGDLVFFERGDNDDCPDHVGCVLAVEGDTLYTIEGNNNNRVGIFSYQFDNGFQFGENTGTYRNNEMIVVGYGQLYWNN